MKKWKRNLIKRCAKNNFLDFENCIQSEKIFNIPKKLYKYCCFDEQKYNLKNLLNNVHYLNNPINFNDPDGNRIFDYVITDKSGKKLLNQSVTFEVIDENHFVSSRNNKKFDIKIQEDNLIIKDLKTKQTRTLELKNFTRDTKELVLPVLKTLPGDELFKMKEIDLKALCATDKIDNAAFSPAEEAIMIKPKYLDDAILLHELGHAKDELMFKEISEKMNKDPGLQEIFNEEKNTYREHFGDSELTKIGYFTADYHYLGANSVHEGIAETNTILSTCPKNEIQSVRSHYWQQYFPRTIAYLAGLLE